MMVMVILGRCSCGVSICVSVGGVSCGLIGSNDERWWCKG